MPYRRLPNTDSARLRAMRKAVDMGKTVSPINLALSQSTLQKVKYFLPLFEQTIIQQKQAYGTQVDRSKEYAELFRRAKLYVSHFIQVLNLTVTRGEHPNAIRKFYELDEDINKVPDLNTENDLIEWGEKIIRGESKRLAIGGNPITNPTIALVKVRYEKFLTASKNQKYLQNNNTRAIKKVADLREEADRIILNIWNEVEHNFSKLPDVTKREESMKYGLVYVWRKSERNNESEEDESTQDWEAEKSTNESTETVSPEVTQNYSVCFSVNQ